MVSILHTADLHIKKEGDERWQALITLLDEAERRKANYLVISGDLFHKNANADQVRHKLRAIFENRKFKTLIIPGNHDAESYGDGAYIAENVILLTQKPYQVHKDESVCFIGIPYEDISSEDLLSLIQSADEELDSKACNIFMFHGDLADIQHIAADMGEDEYDKRYMPARLAYFKSTKADYVLAGHYHTNFSISKFGERRFFVYPGSPVSTTRKELSVRKANFFKLGEVPNEIDIDTFHYTEVRVTLSSEIENPLETVAKAIDNATKEGNIILKIDGFISIDEQSFSKKLMSLKAERGIEHVVEEFRNIEHITSTEVYKAFSGKLTASSEDEGIKDAARGHLFEAASKVLRK